MDAEQKNAIYLAALQKIRDYGGPAFRSTEYAKKVAKQAIKDAEG